MLQAFLDGEVEARRAELVAAHLESCTRCGVERDTLARVIAALRRLRPDLDLDGYTRLTELVERLAADGVSSGVSDAVDRARRPDDQ